MMFWALGLMEHSLYITCMCGGPSCPALLISSEIISTVRSGHIPKGEGLVSPLSTEVSGDL